jgi:hypothetical protein
VHACTNVFCLLICIHGHTIDIKKVNGHTWAYDRYQESQRTRDAHQDAKRSLHGTEQRVGDVRVDRLHADEVCSEGETTTVTRQTGFLAGDALQQTMINDDGCDSNRSLTRETG